MATAQETLQMIITAEDRSSAVLGRIGLSIGAITAAAAGLFAVVKQVANVGDELDKMSIKTGVAVADLSALKLAAELNDASLEEVRIGLTFLQRNLADAAAGGGEAANALKEMGFEQDQIAGGLKNTTGFLEAFARTLFEIPDAAKRTQFAMDVLGRSGTNLLPLLKDIAERGMGGLREESDRLGATWTKQMTEASQRFNDSLTRLGASMQSLKVQYIAPLVQSLADLADKLGLGGPEAQKRIELQSRLSAIEGVRLRLNQQIQVAEEMRSKGLRTGIASDEVFNRLLKTGNELLDERARLNAQLSASEKKEGGGPGIDPATAAASQKIGAGLQVIQERINELFKSGLKPADDEFKRMIETIRLIEGEAHKAFGIDIPANLGKSFVDVNKWIGELSKAAGIDVTSIIKDLPPLLRDAASAGEGFGQMFMGDMTLGGKLIGEIGPKARAVADEIGGWNSRVAEFEAETKKINIPKTLGEWKKGAEGYGAVLEIATEEMRALNLETQKAIDLTNALTSARAEMNTARSLNEALKLNKLTTNEPEY